MVLKEIALLLPMGGPVCVTQFFRPTAPFFRAMEAFRPLDIIDVGAGQGHVAQALRERGFGAVGIDVRIDGAPYPVTQANAVSYPYPAGSVGLIARPCHSAAFVEPVIEQMLDCNVAHILYVGKPKNVAVDLGSYRKMFRRVTGSYGMDGETMLIYSRHRSRQRSDD